MRIEKGPLFALFFILSCIPFPQSSDAFFVSAPVGAGMRLWTGFHTVQRSASHLAPVQAKDQAWARPSMKRASGLSMMEPPPLECVKNVRDLASVTNSPIRPGRVFRAACVGTASESDECILIDMMNIQTLVDLRSEKEWNGDILKYNSTIFESYDPLFYKVKKSKKTGRPKAVLPEDLPSTDPVSPSRTRHLLSVIDESIYKRGVWKKLNLKKKVKALAYMTISQTKARKVFLDYINDAGLPLLNELILDYGGPSVKAVLDVLSDKKNHPVCFYCTAGKDRTGLIAMLVLLCLGVEREAIINDYVISDSVYADLDDKDAMVGALQQQQLDPERFLRAPRNVMETTMDLLYREYGGAEKYMDRIGFNSEDRMRLRAALCDE